MTELLQWMKRKCFTPKPIENMLDPVHQGNELKRVLTLFDLFTMGVGCIIGAGVFVITGEVAHEEAGPGVIAAYLIAAFGALVTALCYAEFAADVPVSGAAYNYVDLVFGQFMSWLTVSAMVMEYLISVSTVAKGFSGYFANLVGLDNSDALLIDVGVSWIVLDIPGCVLVILLTILLAYGVRESFIFNACATSLMIIVVTFIIICGFFNIDTNNYTPFFPKEGDYDGVVGSLSAASVVFFAYIGYDAVATVAEEAKTPSRDVPLGIMLSVSFCTFVYLLMSTVLIGMVPYDQIDIHAAFAVAFDSVGWGWAGKIVSFGALCGILTSLFSTACGLYRMLMVLGREGFIPKWIGHVNSRTHTPLNATILGGAICSIVTLLFDISTLASLVSTGTLFAFFIVCIGSIWRRFCITQPQMLSEGDKSVKPAHPLIVAMLIVALVAVSFVEGIGFILGWKWWEWLITIGFFFAVVLCFFFLPVVFRSTKFRLPLQPLISCLGVLATIHLFVTLGIAAYVRFIIWEVFAILLYFVYGIWNTPEEAYRYRQPLLAAEAGSAE